MAPAVPLLAAAIGAVGAIGSSFLSRPRTPSAPPPVTPPPATPADIVGEPTTLKPGQKVNAIMTTPQGILSAATTGRQTLLGG